MAQGGLLPAGACLPAAPALPADFMKELPHTPFITHLLPHSPRSAAGVHLSPDYLASVAGAEAVTRQLLHMYSDHGVVPIVESEIRK